jgi:hypothetical protein
MTNVEHEATQAKEAGEPFEGVADVIRRLGRKFQKYELIFNPPSLLPMVEKYNLETVQLDGWVPEAFLDAGTCMLNFANKGVPHHTLFAIYDNIHARQEAPWNDGSARLLIITDAVWTVKAWVDANARSAISRAERGRFPADKVLASLERMMGSLGTNVSGKKLRERIVSVRDEIKRRF